MDGNFIYGNQNLITGTNDLIIHNNESFNDAGIKIGLPLSSNLRLSYDTKASIGQISSETINVNSEATIFDATKITMASVPKWDDVLRSIKNTTPFKNEEIADTGKYMVFDPEGKVHKGYPQYKGDINEKLGEIQTTIQELGVYNISTDMSTVIDLLTSTSSNIYVLNGNLSTLNEKILSVSTDINTLNTNLNSVTTDLDNVDTKLSNITSNIDNIDNQLSSLNGEFSQINNELNLLQSDLNKVTSTINSLNRWIYILLFLLFILLIIVIIFFILWLVSRNKPVEVEQKHYQPEPMYNSAPMYQHPMYQPSPIIQPIYQVPLSNIIQQPLLQNMYQQPMLQTMYQQPIQTTSVFQPSFK